MSAANTLKTLAEVSTWQWGLITTAQAENLGVSRLKLSRLFGAGHLDRIRPGVYLDIGVQPSDRTILQAEWLMFKPEVDAQVRLKNLEDEIVIGSTTAAWLHNAGDFFPDPYTFFSAKRVNKYRENTRVRVREIPRSDITIVDGLPVTTQARTALDLLAEGWDLEGVLETIRELTAQTKLPNEFLDQAKLFAGKYHIPTFEFSNLLKQVVTRVEVDMKAIQEFSVQANEISQQLAVVAKGLPKTQVPQDFLDAVENLKQLSSALSKVSSPKT